MGKGKFKLNMPGLNELMKSAEMVNILQEAGNAVASSAGGDYGARVHQANWVAIANVYPTSRKAAKDNYENNTLLRALGSSGLSSQK